MRKSPSRGITRPHFNVSALKEALAACQSPTGINGLLYGCGYQPVLCSLQALG